MKTIERTEEVQSLERRESIEQTKTRQCQLRNIAVVICSMLISFENARNSIIWYCGEFWRASAYFWQSQWNKILDTVGEDSVILHVYGTLVVIGLVYVVVGDCTH
uniref:Uncharacterized protein n=1 Tax=Photinus pyralis TaxID=7054 RepID=A0A1Y1M0P6_PHOPY